METVLLLIVIAAVVAVFAWLGRALGDEWPPYPLPNPLAGGEGVGGGPLPNPLAGGEGVRGPLPESEFALATALSASPLPNPLPKGEGVSGPLPNPLPRGEGVSGPLPNPLPKGEGVSGGPLPSPLPEGEGVSGPLPSPLPGGEGVSGGPLPSPLPRGEGVRSPGELRRVAWTLVGGGGLLLALSQWVGRLMPPGTRLPTFVLFVIGGVALLLGVQTFMRGGLAGWFGRPLARLAAGLRVSPVGAVLLLLALPFAWLTRQAAGNDLLARSATVAIVAWLVGIGFAVAGSRSRARPAGAMDGERADSSGAAVAGRRRHLDRWDAAFSLGIFLLALGLRAWQMSQFPNTYSGDEGSAGLFATELLDGRANNLFGLGWFSFPALYFTVQSAAIALLGQTAEAVRLTSAVAGALTVVAVYWLGRAMFDRTTAVLAALYLAASHYHIHMSRIALNNVWDGLFGTLAILGLWYGWKTGRRMGFILCGLALGLGQYFYVSIRPLPILFLIWAAGALVAQRALFRQRFHGLVLAALIALVIFLPLGLYFVDKPDEFQAPMNRVTIFGPWLEGELARGDRTTTDVILDNATNGLLGFTHEPLRLLYNPGSPLLLAGAAFLFLLGVLWALLNFDLRYLLLFLPLLAVVASNAISQDSPASQRYILAMPLVALFVALPLGEAIVWLRGQYPRYRAAVVVAAFALLALVAAVDVNYYFNRVYSGGYVLGGLNTQVATEIAYFLRDKEPADQDVFFFGFPRMGYYSLSTIPFLAPEKQAQDVIDPLTGPAALPLRGPTLFIFLPERLHELEFVRQQAPDGTLQEFRSEAGELWFVVYETL